MATYKIVSHGGNGLPLNVETTSTISGRTNVNIWKDTGSNDQKWSIKSTACCKQKNSVIQRKTATLWWPFFSEIRLFCRKYGLPNQGEI